MAMHFTTAELEGRRAALTGRMRAAGPDGLLMFRQESMFWLTGYDTFGYVFFQCLVLTDLTPRLVPRLISVTRC